jgi:uridine kinase
LAKALYKDLGEAVNVVYLTHDHYYKDISHKTMEERSKTNFDHPDSLDTALLVKHIQELKAGNTVDLPTYDFSTHSRTPVTTTIHPKRIIIVEGILIFTSPELCDEMDMKVFVVSTNSRKIGSFLYRIYRGKRESVKRILFLSF